MDRKATVNVEMAHTFSRKTFDQGAGGSTDRVAVAGTRADNDRREWLSTATNLEPYGHSGNNNTGSKVLRPIIRPSTVEENSANPQLSPGGSSALASFSQSIPPSLREMKPSRLVAINTEHQLFTIYALWQDRSRSAGDSRPDRSPRTLVFPREYCLADRLL